MQLSEALFEKALKQDIVVCQVLQMCQGLLFFSHEVEEITQKVAILGLILILQKEVVENLKVEVNSREKDNKNDKTSILPLNCN